MNGKDGGNWGKSDWQERHNQKQSAMKTDNSAIKADEEEKAQGRELEYHEEKYDLRGKI